MIAVASGPRISPASMMPAGDLCIITSYFNPAGYQRRLANYRHFRRQLQAPLVTVELAHDGPFQLTKDDADILIQIRGGDILWQKERLLNIALQSVPAPYSKIAWVDCDLLFDPSNWAEKVSRQLDRYSVVQAASVAMQTNRLPLDRPISVNLSGLSLSGPARESVVLGIRLGLPSAELFGPGKSCRKFGLFPGYAWGARRDLLSNVGFYDAAIVGGGDKLMLAAMFGHAERLAASLNMQGPFLEHYLNWARTFEKNVGSEVGYVPHRVVHLWHGDLVHRQHRQRHEALFRHHFDPCADLALDENSVWKWNSPKHALHQYLKDYFRGRHEDG